MIFIFSTNAHAIQRATIRSGICPGMQDFAVQATNDKRLAVIHNPATNMLSVFDCPTRKGYRSTSCKTLYIGDIDSYCRIESSNRHGSLRTVGIIEVANSTYSVSQAGANILAQVQNVRGLRANVQNLISPTALPHCYDRDAILKIVRGESWQNTVENLPDEHVALLTTTSTGRNMPMIGSFIRRFASLLPKPIYNSGVLANSINGTRNAEARRYNRAVRTRGSRSTNFIAELNPASRRNICAVMNGANATQSQTRVRRADATTTRRQSPFRRRGRNNEGVDNPSSFGTQ